MSWLSWDKLCEPKANGGMGFRQLNQFNLVFLAKQGWRLQVMHDSLVYGLFKARYFPHTDFVHASMGNCPWGDKWLPSPSTFKVVSPRLFMHADTRVSELISHVPVVWKMQVIDTLSLPHEADIIKSIPLSTHSPPGKLIWAATTNGLFSVRSAYRLAMEVSRSDTVGSISDGSGLQKF